METAFNLNFSETVENVLSESDYNPPSDHIVVGGMVLLKVYHPSDDSYTTMEIRADGTDGVTGAGLIAQAFKEL